MGSHKANRTSFKPGNKAAQKWTVETVLPYLQRMWDILISEDGLGTPYKVPDGMIVNPVRANDIKFLGELYLMAGVSTTTWDHWLGSILKEDNPVSTLYKTIRTVLEHRLAYSGQVMDIFLLKNIYKYTDKTEVDTKHSGRVDTGADKNTALLQAIAEKMQANADKP